MPVCGSACRERLLARRASEGGPRWRVGLTQRRHADVITVLPVVLGAVVFGRDVVLGALRLHEAFAPLRLRRTVVAEAAAARRPGDLGQRDLRRAVGVEQAVGL